MKRENIDDVLDRRRQWSFSLRDRDGSWSWHVANHEGVETASSESFKSLDECIADAMRHGYVIYEDKERRCPGFPGWDD